MPSQQRRFVIVMMDWRKEMDLLYHLLEQEVSNYHQLISEIKREAQCLREGETEPLMRSVRAIDERIQTIRIIEEQAQKIAEAVLQGLGKAERGRTLSYLSSFLPPAHQSRLSSYLKTLTQLKAWARQINDQNTSFIRDYMNFLSNLISPLTGRWNESMGYPKHKPLTTPASYALSQEV